MDDMILVFWFPYTREWLVSIGEDVVYSFTTSQLAIDTALLIQRIAKGVFHDDLKIRILED